MIVVDSSALVAVALDEEKADVCIAALEGADRLLISAGTVTETLILAHGRGCVPQMTALLDRFGMEVVALTDARARRRAGLSPLRQGWHPAGLNFGDSFA